MTTTVSTTEVNQVLQKLYDFVQENSAIKEDFSEYIKTIGAKDTPKHLMYQVCIPYIFERSVPDLNMSVSEFFYENAELNDAEKEIANAIKSSLASIFEVERVKSNGFDMLNIINEKKYSAISLTKMTEYRGIGSGHFIVARLLKLNGEYFIIEISGILPSAKKDDAMRYAIAKIMQAPYLVYKDNPEKLSEIEQNVSFMYEKFMECFNSDELITTNKVADEIIEMFNSYVENGTTVDLEGKLQELPEYKFFKVRSLENDYSNFIEKSMGSFAQERETYDVGIIYDKETGLYVVPFYKTICEFLSAENIEEKTNYKECINYFLQAESITPNILRRIYAKHPNLVEVINKVTEQNLDFDGVLSTYKSAFLKEKNFSHTTVLYNSKVFSKTLNIIVDNEEKKDIDFSNVKRNDPCPCGSGKKYKHCCLNR